MPFSFLLDGAAVLPLRAIVFQCLLLVVAIALEAIVLRERLLLEFQPSIRYATSLNLLATVLGWIAFLGIEPALPATVRTQIISYVLFGHFYTNSLAGRDAAIVATGLVAFFLTFWIKAKALEWLTWLLAVPIVKPVEVDSNPNRIRYGRSRPSEQTASPHLLAVLQANALSFTAILLLLLLRHVIG